MPSNYAGNPANYPVSITRPSDGDVPDGASVDVGMDELIDRTAYLKNRGLVSVTTWNNNVTGDGPVFWFENDSNAYVAPTPPSGTVDVAGCQVGDIILVDAFFLLSYAGPNGSSGDASIIARMSATQQFGGGTPVTAPIPGAKAWGSNIAGRQLFYPTTFCVALPITSAGTTRIFVETKAIDHTVVRPSLDGSAFIRAALYRTP